MAKKRNRILIVEDDPAQGKALHEVFKRAGFPCTWCTSSTQALTEAQRTEFHLLIVDCLLPKLNGVDLVREIVANVPHKPKILLLSGIFKDRNFIKDAMEKTEADQFFVKPLNLEEVLHHATKLLGGDFSESAPNLQLYTNREFTGEELIQLLEAESSLHAFHLPKLYQRMMETDLRGELTLISTDGEISSVCFFEGHVFHVKTPDKESFFGSLAVSQGYSTPDEVMSALENPSRKMLGQKLIESLSLSPHAVHVILNEQLALRLSQTIRDGMVTVRWLARKFQKPEHTMPENRFEQLVEDWLDSKITSDWVKSTFMSWGPFEIEGDYHPRIHGKKAVESVFSESHFHEEKDLPVMFRALLKGDAFMGARGEPAQDFTFLESRLDKLTNDFERQNYFQILGLSEKAHMREISKAFEGLADAFDPARLPEDCPVELSEKCAHVFKQIEKAKEILSNDIERLRYIQMLQNARTQQLLEAEPQFRAAILQLISGNHADAAKKLDSLLRKKLEFKDLKSYRIWAGLKINRNYSELRLDQIPPEERHSPAYLMAKGVQYRIRGRYRKAIEAFRTAHALDPRINIAKNELKELVRDLERNRTQHREVLREVTSVVENMFGKSRRGA